MNGRTCIIGVSLKKAENEQVEAFMKENELSNKSDLLRWLLNVAGIVKHEETEDLKCSFCDKVIYKEQTTVFADGKIMCEYCEKIGLNDNSKIDIM